jgi:hypothetical protein
MRRVILHAFVPPDGLAAATEDSADVARAVGPALQRTRSRRVLPAYPYTTCRRDRPALHTFSGDQT